jgi:respiratory nitrate reductase gamma subunit
MNVFLWGVFPYICLTLFFVVPVIRMVYRPFGISARSSGLFAKKSLGVASLCMHWGLGILFLTHLAGFLGGLNGWGGWIIFFYWFGFGAGILTGIGVLMALWRRFFVREVRAMSQWDDYVIHVFLLGILVLGLYQVVIHRVFGVAYPASSWLASVARFGPQPELMGGVTIISKLHILLALGFFAIFPFTKAVHVWTFPANFFVRKRQSMRTARFTHHRKWEFAGRTDKSYVVYGALSVIIGFGLLSVFMLGRAGVPSGDDEMSSYDVLEGHALYVSQCARCHGLEGKGDGEGANSPLFAQVPRDLVAGEYRFVSTNSKLANEADLTRVIQRGLVSAGMPSFDRLSDVQVASLVKVLYGMSGDSDEAAGPSIVVPPRPAGVSAAAGRKLYDANCALCHGPNGAGDGPEVAKFDADEVRPADLAGGMVKAGSEADDLYWRITVGVAGTRMYGFPQLTPEQRWDIVEFLQQDLLVQRTH